LFLVEIFHFNIFLDGAIVLSGHFVNF